MVEEIENISVCEFNEEEDECSLKRIHGSDHECKRDLQIVCNELHAIDMSIKERGSGLQIQGELNERCFGKLRIYSDLSKPCL